MRSVFMVNQMRLIGLRRLITCAGLSLSMASVSAYAISPGGFDPSQVLGGDERDACEMLLCLSFPAGRELKECKEPLEKYAKLRDDEKPRFLEKCPQEMSGGDK